MVNSVRTLLLNLRPLDEGGFGEEYIPAAYVPVTLPTVLRTARTALFSRNPSRSDLNLQVGRVLAYLHASPWADDVTADDSRITYDPLRPAGLTAGSYDPPTYSFVSAALGFPGDDELFRPQLSAREAAWQEAWHGDGPAPYRAGALALALAARTAELGVSNAG